MSAKPTIAIATGDPVGIGPEIALKAAIDPAVAGACHPILVGDIRIIERHTVACGIAVPIQGVSRIADADFSGQSINVLNRPQPEAAELEFGKVNPAAGRASIAFCAAAIEAAHNGEVNAVAAAPQHETSIARAGIAFDGHPSFVAKQTGVPADDAYMMLCFGDTRIAHCTLHRSVRKAIDEITPQRVTRVIEQADATLRRLGIARPRIVVSGLNPHAGEGGLFGSEEIEIIAPAIERLAAKGLDVSGPVGADIMFQIKDVDAFVVMLHDQGHVAAKVMAPNETVALTIGTPILFASVAHGTGHDIAGTGVANPKAMIDAILHLAKVRPVTA